MTNNLYGLLFTFLVGIFFLIILAISGILKKKHNFVVTCIGLTFSVMLGMIFFGLLPEAIELLEETNHKFIFLILFIFLGFIVVAMLDKLIPDHHDTNNNLNKNTLVHIGVLTSSALVIHNFVEGASLYSITLNSIQSGFLLLLAIILHNIPLALTVMISLNGNLKGKNIILVILLVISSFAGGLVVYLFNIPNYVLGYLISFTLGMVIYILLFELLKEVIREKKNKYVYWGLVLGLILVILTFLV